MTEKEHKRLVAFLKNLFEPGDAVALSLIPVKGTDGRPFETVQPFTRFLSGLTPAIFDKWKKENRFACFTPNPQTEGKPRRNENTKTINAVFFDIDGGPLPEIAKKAHFVLSRDATHHHVYFLTERVEATEANRERARMLTKRFIQLAGADKAVHDPARVLRLPYGDHVKNGVTGPGYEIRQTLHVDRYTFDELAAMLPADAAAPALSANRESYIKGLYNRRGQIVAGDGRSRTLFFIGLDCHAWGIPEDAAQRVAADINATLCDPPESPQTVAHQIASAYKYRKGPFGEYLTSENEREQRKRLEHFEEVARVRDMLVNHVYVLGAEMLINRDTREQYTTEKQQNLYIAHTCATRLNLSGLLREHAIQAVDRLDFRPDIESDLYEQNGLAFYNRFRVHPLPEPTKNKAPAKLFTEHLKFLTANESEYKALLSFFAFICQNPGKKISWAPLIVSQNHGVGKSILELLFRNIFSREYVTAVEGFELSQPQTDFLTDKLLVIGEEIELGEKNAMPRLRSLITRDSYRNIAKYQRTYDSSNVANFLFFSNRIDALRVDKFDRRLFVVFNRKSPRDAAYYTALADAFTNNASEIFEYLKGVDLGAFNPNERPETTEGKTLLIEQSKSEVEIYLHEEMQNESGEFAYPVVSVKKLLSQIQTYAPETVKRFCGQKAVSFYLIQNGFKSKAVRINEEGESVMRRVWFKGDESDIREMLKRREVMEMEKAKTEG